MAMRRPSPPSWPAEPPDSSPSSIDPPFLFTWDTIRVFLGLGYQKRRRKIERATKLKQGKCSLVYFCIGENLNFWGRFWHIATDDEQHGCMQNDAQSHVLVSTSSLSFIEDKVWECSKSGLIRFGMWHTASVTNRDGILVTWSYRTHSYNVFFFWKNPLQCWTHFFKNS